MKLDDYIEVSLSSLLERVPWRENVSLHLRSAKMRQDFRVEISWHELS